MATSYESPSPPPRLRMSGVCKRFGATVALDGVNLSVGAGEVHALVGENGAGKSTLMKVLSGAIHADSGVMELDGAPYRPRTPLEARRAGVVMVYQELSLAPHLSVEENIVLGMEPLRRGFLARTETRRRAREALARLEHGEISPTARVSSLSVGAQQIVEIARAVALGCRVLVLDEPTSSLSQSDVERLFALVAALKAQGHAIVYISHFLEEVKRVSDRFSVLRDGRTVGSGATASVSTQDMVAMMVGRRIEQLYPRSSRRPGEIALELRGFCGHRRPVAANLTLRRGEILGIAGLVGAGRTELLRAVFGLDAVRRGDIRVGVWPGPAAPSRRWRQGVGMLSEDRKGEGLAISMTLADNTTLSHLEGLGPFGLVLPARQAAATRRWIERLDIRCRSARQKVAALSGGNQQKVALARLLHHDVDVWLLDEPTRGIDVASKALIYRLMDKLAGDPLRPRAILMVSSYPAELLGMCDRIAVMHRGRLGPVRPAPEWSEHALMLEATAGARSAHIPFAQMGRSSQSLD